MHGQLTPQQDSQSHTILEKQHIPFITTPSYNLQSAAAKDSGPVVETT